jgi:hypothetical protein
MKPKAYKNRIRAAKAYAKKHGVHGQPGGWIYSPNGEVICQGWFEWTRSCEARGVIRPVGGWPRCTCSEAGYPSVYRPHSAACGFALARAGKFEVVGC